MAIPETNPLTPDKIALGRRLFFDTSLSIDRTMSCATCHDPERSYTDGRAVAKGVHDAAGARNTPTILNAGFGRAFSGTAARPRSKSKCSVRSSIRRSSASRKTS